MASMYLVLYGYSTPLLHREWHFLAIWNRADVSDLDPLPALRHHRVLKF